MNHAHAIARAESLAATYRRDAARLHHGILRARYEQAAARHEATAAALRAQSPALFVSSCGSGVPAAPELAREQHESTGDETDPPSGTPWQVATYCGASAGGAP